ncbi:MAG: hypothetical protein ACR2JO_11965 [Mycobacteriales bacterium]|jgi:hypothetical protein
MKTILVLAVIALAVAVGFVLFGGVGPRTVVRRRVVDRPSRVRRRVVTEEVDDVIE